MGCLCALRIVGREDFIAMKCFAGSPQDLLDARSAYHLEERTQVLIRIVQAHLAARIRILCAPCILPDIS